MFLTAAEHCTCVKALMNFTISQTLSKNGQDEKAVHSFAIQVVQVISQSPSITSWALVNIWLF